MSLIIESLHVTTNSTAMFGNIRGKTKKAEPAAKHIT